MRSPDPALLSSAGAFSFIKNRHSNRMEVAHIVSCASPVICNGVASNHGVSACASQVRVEKGQENIGFLPAKNGKSLNDSDEILERAFVLVGQDRCCSCTLTVVTH